MKVLVVEDDPVMRHMVEILLTRRRIDYATANDGRQALEAWERENFDLIVMDIQMPEMDGLEATAHIRERERERGGHTPVVAMTAWAMPEDEERCLAAGMDDYLSKPIEFARFYQLLAKYASPPHSQKQ